MSKEAQAELPATQEAGVPAEVADFFAEHAGEGVEFQQGEVSMPMMILCQDNTIWVQDETFPEALPGVFVHTTSVSAHRSFDMIVCLFQKRRALFKDRGPGNRGTFVEAIGNDDDLDVEWDEKRRGFYLVENPDLCYVEKYQYFGILFGENGAELGPGMLSLQRSQVKNARKLNGMLQARTIEVAGVRRQAPIFAFRYHVGSQDEVANGKKFKGFLFSPGPLVADRALLERAAKLHADMKGQADRLADLDEGTAVADA